MRIVIVGLGGVGGVVGGRLAAGLAGSREHQAIFWCRGETLAAIKEKGLELHGHDGALNVRPYLASNSIDEVKSADLIILAVKSYHLEAAAREIAPVAGGGTTVLPLLNGVSPAEELKTYLPESDVLGGCIYVSAHVKRPGVVQQAGAVQRVLFGKKGLSRSENLKRYGGIEQVLKTSGISITLTEKIEAEMWSKMIFLSPFAGVTTLFKRSIGEALGEEESLATVTRMIAEIEALARAKNIALPENIAEFTLDNARAFAPLTKTSMQIDRENGRQTELESLIGYVCREGKTLGLSLPTYDRVYEGLKGIC